MASRDFSVSLPIFGINVSRVSPFKSKINTGKPKWYENIGVTYVFEAKYFLNTYDSLIGNADTWRRNGQFGIKNNINIDAPFTVLKYFTVNPSFSYNERWYFKSVNKTWITQDAVVNLPGRPPIILPGVASYVKTDTINKFVADRDFSTSITLSTKLIGTYNFKGKLVKSFRHILTPSISGNFRPDFGTPYWGCLLYTSRCV